MTRGSVRRLGEMHRQQLIVQIADLLQILRGALAVALHHLGDLYPFDRQVGEESLQRALSFAQSWHGAADGRITVMLGPQAPDMMDREQLLDVKRAAEKLGLMIHMHVAQGYLEIDQMVKSYCKRTPQYLQEIG